MMGRNRSSKKINHILPMKSVDIRTGRIIGRDTEKHGLYYVDEVTQSGTVMLAHGTTEREAWLWHRSSRGVESCDTLNWLTYEESYPVHSITSREAHVQSSPISSATEYISPNLISEVSNSQPSDSQTSNSHDLVETTGNVEPEQQESTNQKAHEQGEHVLEEVSNKYTLPARANRGISAKWYSPERFSKGSKYPMANIANGYLSEEANAFSASLYSEETPLSVEQALKSEE
nr:ribonuclease H-like domain-containing protein [Tanacetum cinerariifolium]